MRTEKVYEISQFGFMGEFYLILTVMPSAGACFLLAAFQWMRGGRFEVLAAIGVFFILLFIALRLPAPHLTIVIDGKGIAWGPLWARQFVPWSQITNVSLGNRAFPKVTLHLVTETKTFRVFHWSCFTPLRLALGETRRNQGLVPSKPATHPLAGFSLSLLVLISTVIFGAVLELLSIKKVLTGFEDEGISAVLLPTACYAAWLIVRPCFFLDKDTMVFGQFITPPVKIPISEVNAIEVTRALDSSGKEQITSLTVLSGKKKEEIPTHLPDFPEIAESILKRLPATVKSVP